MVIFLASIKTATVNFTVTRTLQITKLRREFNTPKIEQLYCGNLRYCSVDIRNIDRIF